MLLSKPLASLITFFRMSLIKFYHDSQRMSDSVYRMTECFELNNKEGLKYTAKCGQPCVSNFALEYICIVLPHMPS